MKINIFPNDFEEAFTNYPLTLVDVGASGGLRSPWKRHGRYLRVIGFEPDSRAYSNLNKKDHQRINYFDIALNRDCGNVTFYLTRKQENSSCFMPNKELLERFQNPERFEVINKSTMKCNALDNLMDESNTHDIDFIKCDTQGSELDILRGSKKLLTETVFGLELEVAFAPIYIDAPLFAEIDIFVRELGFSLMDLRTVFWKRSVGVSIGNPKGQLMYADALYFKGPMELKYLLNSLEGKVARSKLLRALCVCQIYGYLDYALELLDIIGKEYFSEEEVRRLCLHVQSQRPMANKIADFPGKDGLYRMLTKLAKLVQPRSHRLKQKKLGNI